MKAVFLRVAEAADKAAALRAVSRQDCAGKRFELDPAIFFELPRSPFAYWVSSGVRAKFSSLAALGSERRRARQGLATASDFQFVRLWTEVPHSSTGKLWRLFAKGGKFSPFYSDIHLVLNWTANGAEICSFPRAYVRNPNFYTRPGLTWPLRTQAGLSFRVLPAGCIFGHKGPAVFIERDNIRELLTLLAVVNSVPFCALVDLQMAFGSYEVGVLQRTPVPDVDDATSRELAAVVREAWLIQRRIDSRSENSHAFVSPALIEVTGATLLVRAETWRALRTHAETELTNIQREIDEACFSLYGIDADDRRSIEQGFEAVASLAGEGSIEAEEYEEEQEEIDAVPLAISLLSWSVGVSWGRFDVRLATGEREPPTEPEPFDPLPACSPGMLTGGDGLPLHVPPEGYPIHFPHDGILLDDPGHDQDLYGRARQVFQTVFGEEADARLQEAAEIIDSRGRTLRSWFAGSFFEHHVKRYSRSRRKAPIYWQLATPSASYSVWLYYHRFTRDTLYRVLNQYVAPKLEHEERKLTSLIEAAGPNPSSSERKEIDSQQSFVEELRAFRQEVERVAPLWNPDLNDGVIINFAPLWRLVPQSRSWQRECRKIWDKLVEGDYDWSHLAMHLWPERVVPKCIEDRSLAIAHGLEETLWEEDDDGKWQARAVEESKIRALVEERSSAAVKAALEDLLSAPTSSGRGRRRAGRR